MTARCPAGHEMPGRRKAAACLECRRNALIRHVISVDGTLAAAAAAAGVDAAAATPAALRELAAALAADPDMLRHGAPPVAGRLAAELIARGSVSLTMPACARCGRDGRPLYRTAGGGMCKPCAARVRAAACAHCGEIKAIAGRDASGQCICERCRRRDRGHRQCGQCWREAPIAVRARDGAPDICVNCYRMPGAVCNGCGKYRPCNFAGSSRPVCPSCSPKATARCARCGQDRPPQARWPEGPVCDPCYTAALRHRARCAGCGQDRRLVFPPGPEAVTCADCAGLPAMSACTGCGIEDKLYEKGLCARCSLRQHAAGLLSGGTGDVPAPMSAVLEAICAARNPHTALNWLRNGAGGGRGGERRGTDGTGAARQDRNTRRGGTAREQALSVTAAEVVRVLLDHSSTQMTAHYAKITDQTVRRRWEQATRVNISGERVTIDPGGPPAQAQWAKTRYGIATQTLPNGYCGLPVQRQCPHANACLTCPVFITGPEFLPELRQQQQRTLTLITAATENGHARVTEMNEQVAANLDRMISELETITGDGQQEAAGAS